MTDERNVIRVWEEFIDGKFIAWVSEYRPLHLHSQGETKDVAVEAMREAIASWHRVMASRYEVHVEPDHNYRTGVHIARAPEPKP